MRQLSGMKSDFITSFVSGLGSDAGSVKFVHPSLKLRVHVVFMVDSKYGSVPHVRSSFFNSRPAVFLIEGSTNLKVDLSF